MPSNAVLQAINNAQPAQITTLDKPTPLPENDLIAPEIEESLLPENWKEWLTDVAERMQCPLDYPTIAAIIGAAALIGNKICIRPKQLDPWMVTANLWGAVVGLPSLLKSPAVKEGISLFQEIADQERLQYEAKLKDAEFEREFAEAKRSDLTKLMKKDGADKEALRNRYKSLEVEEPKEKRILTADATVEKLGELLNENENGLLLMRDELTGWLRSLDRAGREQDRSFYLECWDGNGSFTFDRIGRGTIHIKNLTLSILGTIQPAMLEPYLRGSLKGNSDDGLVQRFQLLVYPNKPKTYRFIDRLPKGREKARAIFRGLHQLSPEVIGARQLAREYGGRYYVQFNNEAQEFFQFWLTELENNLRNDTFDTPAIESHIAKYRSLMPTLALIFHLLDCVSNRQSKDVTLENAQKAAAWCEYLQLHAERIYKSVALSEFNIAREILKKIESQQIGKDFTARDIYSKHWSKLNDPKDVQNGLEILVEYGYLTFVIVNGAYRSKTVYSIHESLK